MKKLIIQPQPKMYDIWEFSHQHNCFKENKYTGSNYENYAISDTSAAEI